MPRVTRELMENHPRTLGYRRRLAQTAAPDGAPRSHRPVRPFINPNGPWFHDQQECDDKAQSVLTQAACRAEADRVPQAR